METQEISDIFPLLHNLDMETIEWLRSRMEEDEYASKEVIISEDSWGKAVYFIVSGWVKLENTSGEENITIEIIGKGGCVGEMGILDASNHNTRVIAISEVKVLTISAQRFIQVLFRDAQIQNRFLKLMVSRINEYQRQCQFYRQTPKFRLASILISLADKYGELTEKGVKLYNFSPQDLANLSQLNIDECSQIIQKLTKKNILQIDQNHHSMYIINLKQLHHLIGKLGHND